MKFETFKFLVEFIQISNMKNFKQNEKLLEMFNGDSRVLIQDTTLPQIAETLYIEYPKTKEVIEYFCFVPDERSIFFIDGIPYKDTIENLWLECEGRLSEQSIL